MRRYLLFILAVLALTLPLFITACSDDDNMIPVPMTEQFEQSLSFYNIYQGEASDLLPSEDYHLLELSSSLFVNYAEKQRLVKLPAGEQMTFDGSGIPTFPDGTILVKTFYYSNDVRNPSLGKQLIETRLLVKNTGIWNVATYVWNEAQTEASLDLNGFDTQVSWINSEGTNRTIDYQVPNQEECVACHQINSTVLPIGPTLRNLNYDVIRNNETVNQLQHLQNLNLLDNFDINQVSSIVNYNDLSASISDRGRAYLDLNCAHCHNPAGWSRPAGKGYDFQYETAIGSTRILEKKDKIREVIQTGEMPYLGNTVLDEEGFDLIVEYLNSL